MDSSPFIFLHSHSSFKCRQIAKISMCNQNHEMFNVIKIQGPGCFATRNPPVVIYVITGSSIWRVYNFQYFTKFFLEIIVKIIMLSLTWKEKFSIKMALEGLPHPQLSALPFVAADFHFVQREIIRGVTCRIMVFIYYFLLKSN